MYQTRIFPNHGGVKKQPPREIIETETIEEGLDLAVKLVKSWPRGRPYPILVFNEEDQLVQKALVQGTRAVGLRGEITDPRGKFVQRMKDVQIPLSSTHLRRANLPILLEITDVDPKGGPPTEEEREGLKLLRRVDPAFKPGTNARDDPKREKERLERLQRQDEDSE